MRSFLLVTFLLLATAHSIQTSPKGAHNANPMEQSDTPNAQYSSYGLHGSLVAYPSLESDAWPNGLDSDTNNPSNQHMADEYANLNGTNTSINAFTTTLNWASDWAGLFYPEGAPMVAEIATLALQVYQKCPTNTDNTWVFSNGWQLAFAGDAPLCVNVRRYDVHSSDDEADYDTGDKDEHDNVAIFTKTINNENHCALVFEGTTGFPLLSKNWQNNKNSKTVKWCGHDVHQGFADEVGEFSGNDGAVGDNDYLKNNAPTHPIITQKLKDYFKNQATCTHRYYSGHSLGGAQAELFGLCMMSPTTPDRAAYDGTIYTFAAPSTYAVQDETTDIWRPYASETCVKGMRVVNYNDVVPGAPNALYYWKDYRHGPIKAMVLNPDGRGDIKNCKNSTREPGLGISQSAHSMALHVNNLMHVLHEGWNEQLWIEPYLGTHAFKPGQALVGENNPMTFAYDTTNGVFTLHNGACVCVSLDNCFDFKTQETVALRFKGGRTFRGMMTNTCGPTPTPVEVSAWCSATEIYIVVGSVQVIMTLEL